MAKPLTKEHLAQMKEVLAASKTIKEVIARAKVAEIDVIELENQLLANERQLQKIIAAFFPAGR